MKSNILKSVDLKNFLCHDHIAFNFTKKITLIGGRNGSGKSAVMLAIGLALGQKKFLERGNFINFIKTNSNFCRIKLVLNNYDNFISDFFDDEIIIVKTIIKRNVGAKVNDINLTQNNITQINQNKFDVASKLEIRNKKGVLWSSKQKDLTKILDFYSLQLNNPLNFLTQENAKKFLNIKDSKEIYKLFLEGLELIDMKILHDETKKNAIFMQEKIEELKKELKRLNSELSLRNEKIQSFQNIEAYEKTLLELEIEHKYAKLDFTSLKLLENEIKKLQIDYDEYCLSENELINKHSILRDQLISREKEMMQKQKDKIEIKDKLCEDINALNRQKREIENDIGNLNEEIKNLIVRIEENEKQKDEKEIDTICKTIEQKKEELKQHTLMKTEQDAQFKNIQMLFQKEEERLKIVNTQINHIRKMIDENNRINRDNLSFFGEDMQKLIYEVKNTKFKGNVIGPLATEITLKEGKWFRPVSMILNNVLGNFIVFEREDREKMHSIMKKYKLRGNNIIIPNNRSNILINYNKNRHFKTVLDVLEIKNNMIINQLIILLSIEQIILIDDRQKAYEIIKKRPQYVDCAYTITGDQIKMFGNSLSDFGKSGNEKYFFENTADKITDLEIKLKELTGQNLQNVHREDYIDLKKRGNFIEANLNRLEKEIKGFEIDYNAIINTQKKITDEEVENIKETCTMFVNQKNELLTALKHIEAEITDKHIILTQNTMEEKQDKTDVYVQCKKIENDLDRVTTNKNKLNSLLHEKNREFCMLQGCITAAKEKLFKLGPEPERTRKTAEIESDMNSLMVKIEHGKKNFDKDKTLDEINEILQEIKLKNNLLDKNETKIFEIYESAEKRILKREEIKIQESKRAINEFIKYANLRDYEGCLVFDHENEALEIKLKMKNNSIAGKKGTLSGGERSYASICLLLSLWPSVCCSLKILDEFDVYMDNLNRRCALEMIVKYCNKMSGQVILITPLDTDQFFNDSCDVVVLNPPKKN